MILRFEEITERLLKAGFSDVGSTNGCSRAFWKHENGSDLSIVLVDAINDTIRTNYGLERLLQDFHMKYSNIHPDNTLVIIWGAGVETKIRGANIIRVNYNTSKVKGHIADRRYQEVWDMLSSKNMENKLEDAKLESVYGVRRHGYSTVMVWIIIGLNIWCFYHTFLSGYSTWGISADAVHGKGESYRLITYMFMHANIRHLVSNTVSLIIIGRVLSKRIGNIDFLIVYFSGGIIAGLASMFTAINISGNTATLTVGASGAIFAVLGALLVDVLMDKNMRGNRSAYVKYAVYMLIVSSIGIFVDKGCHIGGFAGGMLVMWLLCMLNSIHEDRAFIKSSKKLLKLQMKNVGKRKENAVYLR